MQVVEKPVEGLSRSYGVTVPAAELGAALDVQIAELLPTLRLKGFRPGKVPQAHVRRMYGKALMSEVVEKTLNETSQQVLTDHQLRIASRPDLKPVSDMEQVLAGREDLAYEITKVLLERSQELASASGAAREITPVTAVRGSPVPFHPGALRYYREAGIAIPQS